MTHWLSRAFGVAPALHATSSLGLLRRCAPTPAHGPGRGRRAAARVPGRLDRARHRPPPRTRPARGQPHARPRRYLGATVNRLWSYRWSCRLSTTKRAASGTATRRSGGRRNATRARVGPADYRARRNRCLVGASADVTDSHDFDVKPRHAQYFDVLLSRLIEGCCSSTGIRRLWLGSPSSTRSSRAGTLARWRIRQTSHRRQGGTVLEIVGVVQSWGATARCSRGPQPTVYFEFAKVFVGRRRLRVRTSTPPEALLPRLR